VSPPLTQISQLQLVMIPSSDQDRSIAFYEALGFEKRSDIPWGGGHRWVEVYPPNGAAGIALIPPGPDQPSAVQTGIILNTDDIDAAHAHLQFIGADADAQIARGGSPAEIQIGAVTQSEPAPPMFWFRDPDGNALLVVQPG
jgi:catechol 2,3-dioxygenase-like lactoylglutathione lyase family enzyme